MNNPYSNTAFMQAQKSATLAPSVGHLTSILNELDPHLASLHELRQRLGALATRILGPQPEVEKNEKSVPTPPPSATLMSGFAAFVNNLNSAINELRKEVARLEEL